MLKIVFLLLVGLGSVAAVTHSLKYFYTGSSGIPNFPEFVGVGMVDDVPMVHYDSNTNMVVPKQDWMNKITVDAPQYWQRNTRNFVATQQTYKANIEIVKQRFNQTGGVHIYQNMYGCELDDETGKVVGNNYQFGYDGEDFIALDQNMESWIASKPEAVITKHKWDQDKAFKAQRKNYLTHECPEWLQKYLNYGRSSLMRTERPSVSLLQKTSSSPVICHATGFYPNRAEMFWRKNGEETHEGVDKGEILPNNDGTFQMSVDLKLPSSEDWTKYECVFQLSGVNDDIITHLEKAGIRTNEGKPDLILPVIIGVLVAVVVFAVVGFILYKKNLPPFKKNDKRSPSDESLKRQDSLESDMSTRSGGSDESTRSGGSDESTRSGGSDESTRSGGSDESIGSDTPLIKRK